MSKQHNWKIGWVALLVLSLFALSACGMVQPAKKPEVGPAGKPVEAKPNPPVMERFRSAPTQLYDLEAIAGSLFEGINKGNWPQAESGIANLQTTWEQTKQIVGEKKGVKDADEAIAGLTASVMGKKAVSAYEDLTKFMSSVSDVGKSYKLSPIADIITVGNAIRNVSFYVQDRNWNKAASKAKDLENTWNQAKPSVEQVGVLGSTTTTHSYVKQLKDSVDAESQGAAEEHIANLNESMGLIREYYRGK